MNYSDIGFIILILGIMFVPIFVLGLSIIYNSVGLLVLSFCATLFITLLILEM